MASLKETKREVSDFWKRLKQERRTRSKLEGAADLAESAARLVRFAGDLERLSVRMGWHESRANQPIRPKRNGSKIAKAADGEKAGSPPRRNSRKRSLKNPASTEKADEQG